MDVPVAFMGAFRRVHALLFISVKASIPSPKLPGTLLLSTAPLEQLSWTTPRNIHCCFVRGSSGGFHGSLRAFTEALAWKYFTFSEAFTEAFVEEIFFHGTFHMTWEKPWSLLVYRARV